MAGIVKTNICMVFYLLMSSVLDITVTTVLYAHGNQFRVYFGWVTEHYDFKSSLLGLWVCSIARSVIILGCLLGILFNKTITAVKRVQKINYIMLVVAMLMWAFPFIKLLCVSEYAPNMLKQPWFWSEFAWSVLAAWVFYGNYVLLCRVKLPLNVNCASATVVNINDITDDERPHLLHEQDVGCSEAEPETEDEERVESKAVTIWRLLSYSKPDAHLLTIAFIFLLISTGAEIFTPYYTGQLIQGIAIEKSQALFTRAIIIMSVLSFASALAAGVRGGVFKLAMSRLSIRIRNTLFSAIIKQEVGFFDTTATGDITSRLTSDASTMSDALGYNTNIFLRSGIKGIGTCVFMFSISWRLTLVTLVALPIIVWVSHIYGEYYQSLSKQVQDSLAKANEVAEETYSSLRTVRSFANERAETELYASKLQATYRINIKESIVYAGYAWTTLFFELFLVVATLYYGGHLVLDDILTGGHLVSFILYQMELGFAIEEMSEVYTGLMQAVGASEKVFEFIDREPKIANSGKLKPNNLDGRIEFRDVAFAYPSRPDTQVLNGVSFRVEPGEVVALVGPSGGGKSSCVNLLEHFYETAAGQVLLDDQPIQDYDHAFLHEKVALVGQEPVLYARSIKENIAYGLDKWDLDLVQNAATMANAHQFISEMNRQYDTETGEKGLQMSGGQKQRIAIARALIRNPAVLLLDEATSALDSESEHVVQEAIYKNLKGRTVIVVAHRLSTVERADRIVVIDKGNVIEQGSHTQLLQQDGLYAKLVKRQLLGPDSGNCFTDNAQLPTSGGHVSCNSFKPIPEAGWSVGSSTDEPPKFSSQ